VDPSGTKFVRDLSTAMLVELFQAGLGDAIIADLVTATVLQDNGYGHISFEHAKAGGIMPNSVYYCRTERLDELAPALTAFVAAVGEAMDALTRIFAQRFEPQLGPARRVGGVSGIRSGVCGCPTRGWWCRGGRLAAGWVSRCGGRGGRWWCRRWW
jgi:hypothetical protein